jgi:hypothetical protein
MRRVEAWEEQWHESSDDTRAVMTREQSGSSEVLEQRVPGTLCVSAM